LRNNGIPRASNICLSHQRGDRLYVAEHDGVALEVIDSDSALAVTNHCLLRGTSTPPPAASVERLQWLRERLASANCPRDAAGLLAALCAMPSSGTLRFVAVVDAAHGDLLLDVGTTQARVHVGALLPATAPPAETVAASPMPPLAALDPARTQADSPSMRFRWGCCSPWDTCPRLPKLEGARWSTATIRWPTPWNAACSRAAPPSSAFASRVRRPPRLPSSSKPGPGNRYRTCS
jgi:hypothetical protein